jgi:hypothetical protein
MRRFFIAAAASVLIGVHATAADNGQPWTRHTIDDSARGADGVRLADANGDGLLDIATGWEEAGLIRLYLNPGQARAKERWPAVTVGQVKSPEDAVLVDLDGDGAVDVVSCCEGKTRSVFVHWAPKVAGTLRVPSVGNGTRSVPATLLDETAWTTEAFPALAGQMMAMYCLPLQIDGRHGIDLVIGGKGSGAEIGWLEAPAKPRDLAAWRWHPLFPAGWIMSLVAADIDADGDQDVLASDRKGKYAGCLWLENPGVASDQTQPWERHAFGPPGAEVMFLDYGKFGRRELSPQVVVPTYDKQLFVVPQSGIRGPKSLWQPLEWPRAFGKGKGVRVADVDLDGRIDLVMSSENYEGTCGLVWCTLLGMSGGGFTLQTHDISGLAGPKGMKLDDIQLLDLDGDGDQDVLTTEERTGWGVVWFENPTR